MTGETTRSRNRAGQAGLFNSLLALTSALAVFFESRLALFTKESKAALVQILALAACLIAAMMLFAFGYVFLIASAVIGIARVAQVSWVWIALAAAGLHFLVALICLLIARSRMTKPMFQATSAELKKDAEWLKTLNTTDQPRS